MEVNVFPNVNLGKGGIGIYTIAPTATKYLDVYCIYVKQGDYIRHDNKDWQVTQVERSATGKHGNGKLCIRMRNVHSPSEKVEIIHREIDDILGYQTETYTYKCISENQLVDRHNQRVFHVSLDHLKENLQVGYLCTPPKYFTLSERTIGLLSNFSNYFVRNSS